MARRTLSLRSEALSELTATDLARVAGGAQTLNSTCPVLQCLTRLSDAASCTPSCGYTGCCPTGNC